MKLHNQVLVGAVLGIIAGLVLGHDAHYLRPIGQVYIMLLVVVVYPYIICSLIASLGSITPQITRRLLKSGIMLFLLLLIVTFLVLICVVQFVPHSISYTMHYSKVKDYLAMTLNMLIPKNIFASLTDNYVPAVVVFCVLFGLALQHYQKRDRFIDVLNSIRYTCIKLWGWIIYLAPVSIFAMLADTFGQASLVSVRYYSAYIIAFYLAGIAIVFIIIPFIMSAFIPHRVREIVSDLKDALIIALATALSASALPIIEKSARKIAQHVGIEDSERDNIVKTSLTISYPFGQIGNFFIYIFIYFAAFLYNAPISPIKRMFLPVLTVLSGFGSPSSIVNSGFFLTTYLHIPPHVIDLFMDFFSLTRYPQIAVSVAGIFFLTVLSTLAYYKKLCFCWRRFTMGLIALLLTLGALLGVAVVLNKYFMQFYKNSYSSAQMSSDLIKGMSVKVYKPGEALPPSPPLKVDGVLTHILHSHELRVGYFPQAMPYVYFNRQGQLIGLDVAMMYQLARELGCKLVFIPYKMDDFQSGLMKNQFDIAIGGLYVSANRFQNINFTRSYEQTKIAFLVRRETIKTFADDYILSQRGSKKIAVLDSTVLERHGRLNFPAAELISIKNINQIRSSNDIAAVLWTQKMAIAYALSDPVYRSFTTNHLKYHDAISISLGVGKHAEQLRNFLNVWIEKARTKKFIKEQSLYWFYFSPLGHQVKRDPWW